MNNNKKIDSFDLLFYSIIFVFLGSPKQAVLLLLLARSWRADEARMILFGKTSCQLILSKPRCAGPAAERCMFVPRWYETRLRSIEAS